MGKLIGTLAEEKGYGIGVMIDYGDAGLSADALAPKLAGCNVAIDFTTAKAVQRNVEACVIAGVPLVEGTTGWSSSLPEIKKLVIDGNGTMVFGANFSIGVNLFYRIAEFASELLSKFPEYEVFIEEQHHSRKKDAPSGTALKIKEVVSKNITVGDIAATRAGNIPGTHRVGFDGPADQILLVHTARSREGFALGALMAAGWVVGKKGFFEFGEVLEEILNRKDTKARR